MRYRIEIDAEIEVFDSDKVFAWVQILPGATEATTRIEPELVPTIDVRERLAPYVGEA